ncbi:MAG: hypothetical protein R3C28_28800 [Pirellulaceae bacterium]
MQPYNSDHRPDHCLALYRTSWLEVLGQGVIAVTLLLIFPAFVLGWQNALDVWTMSAISSVAIVVARWFGVRLLRLLSADNWTMGIAHDGVWLNLRSVHNRQFEPATSIVFLPFDDIRSVRTETMQRTTETADSTCTWKEVTLCFSVPTAIAASLRNWVAAERLRRFEHKTWFGMTIRGRENHVPVMVDRDDNVVVYWHSRSGRLTPHISDAINRLSSHLQVESGQSNKRVDWRELSDQQLDSYLLYLVEANDHIEAIKILVRRKGYSVRDAKRFVDELGAQLPAV